MEVVGLTWLLPLVPKQDPQQFIASPGLLSDPSHTILIHHSHIFPSVSSELSAG